MKDKNLGKVNNNFKKPIVETMGFCFTLYHGSGIFN